MVGQAALLPVYHQPVLLSKEEEIGHGGGNPLRQHQLMLRIHDGRPGRDCREKLRSPLGQGGGHHAAAGLAAGIDPGGINGVAAPHVGNGLQHKAHVVQVLSLVAAVPEEDVPQAAGPLLIHGGFGEDHDEAPLLRHTAHGGQVHKGVGAAAPAMHVHHQRRRFSAVADRGRHVLIPDPGEALVDQAVLLHAVLPGPDAAAEELAAEAAMAAGAVEEVPNRSQQLLVRRAGKAVGDPHLGALLLVELGGPCQLLGEIDLVRQAVGEGLRVHGVLPLPVFRHGGVGAGIGAPAHPYRDRGLGGVDGELRFAGLHSAEAGVKAGFHCLRQIAEGGQAGILAAHLHDGLLGHGGAVPQAQGIGVVGDQNVVLPGHDLQEDLVHIIRVAALRVPAPVFGDQDVKGDFPLLSKAEPEAGRQLLLHRDPAVGGQNEGGAGGVKAGAQPG